jgi:mercuric ion transport protein
MSELTRLDDRVSRPADVGNDDAAERVTPGLLAAGGFLAALGVSSCCVLPFLFFTLGISGAWIGNLTALSPYQPIFVAAAVGFLGLGFWRVYRRPKAAFADDSYCARPAANRLAKAGLISATVLVVAALGFNPVAALFIN